MSELLGVFKAYLLWSLMLWVLVFVAFAAIFARGQLSAFAGGLARIFVAVFVSPFVFIRKATASILSFDREREEAYQAGDQYLLNKGMLVVQAIVIVAAIGAIAGAIVATWQTWVPPSEVRQAAREYRPKVSEQRAIAADTAAEVARLDGEWPSKQIIVVGRYRAERQKSIDSARAAMALIEKELAQFDAVAEASVQRIKAIADGTVIGSTEDIESAKRSLDRVVYDNWWTLSEWGKDALQRWNAIWTTKALAEVELRNVPTDALRAEAQPGYAAARANSETAAETLSEMEQTLREREEAASLKWKAAAWRALISFASILLFVWLLGLAIEAAWLTIRVAGDVRRLRELNELPSPPSGAAADLDPRVPIRRPAVEQPLPPAALGPA